MGRPLSLEYVAGFFDGEGCISVHRGNGIYLFCSISQNSKEVLEEIQQVIGGKIYEALNRYNRTTYKIHWNGLAATAMLLEILPFLIVKKAQADLALTIPHGRLTEEVAQELTRLKDRGGSYVL